MYERMRKYLCPGENINYENSQSLAIGSAKRMSSNVCEGECEGNQYTQHTVSELFVYRVRSIAGSKSDRCTD